MGSAFDIVLVLLLLGLAAWIGALRQDFGAVAGFVAFGLLLSLAWVRLHAADVALTESAIGGAATGVLLLGAAVRLRGEDAAEALPAPWIRVAAASLCALVAAALAAAVLLLPEPAPTLAPQAVAHMPGGITNPVTAVLIDYRAFDTLLEKIVLLLALVGVWSATPDPLWGGRPGPRVAPEAGGALTLLAQILPPIGIAVAVHLLWVGASEPGGAFQSAAVLAAMWILVMRSGLIDAPPVGSRRLRLVLVVGPVVFLVTGFAGVPLTGWFLAYPPAYAKAIIVGVEIVLTVSIAAIVGLLVAGPAERAPEP